jgi:hypothetical protein
VFLLLEISLWKSNILHAFQKAVKLNMSAMCGLGLRPRVYNDELNCDCEIVGKSNAGTCLW